MPDCAVGVTDRLSVRPSAAPGPRRTCFLPSAREPDALASGRTRVSDSRGIKEGTHECE